MKRLYVLPVLIVLALATVGCGRSDPGAGNDTAQRPRSTSSGPSQSSVQGKGPVEALALANEWKGNDVTTFVTTESINFEFPGGATTSVRLPADKMVVAIAPYISQTHLCETPYMSGCQGELIGEPINVVARLADGTIVVDDTIRTMTNGFIELWLPRDNEISISLAAAGKSVDGTIGTFADSQTCITTLQLL